MSTSDKKSPVRIDPAIAAIEFALTLDGWEAKDFLNAWMHGDFPEIRRDWPKAPEAIYIGADPLHPETRVRDGHMG